MGWFGRVFSLASPKSSTSEETTSVQGSTSYSVQRWSSHWQWFSFKMSIWIDNSKVHSYTISVLDTYVPRATTWKGLGV